MIYLLFIVLISVFFCYIAPSFRHKQVPFVVFAISGVLVLFVASLLYTFRMSGIYNSNLYLSFRFIYRIATEIKISFQEIYRMTLIGSFLIFMSCISMTFAMKHKAKRSLYIFALIPLYLYLFINDPDVSYKLYLQSSAGRSVVNIIRAINIYNIALTGIYMVSPVISILSYYRKTTFMIKKKHSVFMLMYMVMYYALILIMHSVGFIRFFQLNGIDIFRFESMSVSDLAFSSAIMFISLSIFVIAILTIKTSKMQNYSTKTMEKNTAEIDKNLRMILHTYKNHFFAINQQITFLKTINEPHSEETKKILDAIDEISVTSMNEISDRINALKNIKMSYKPIDLNVCIDSAIKKIYIPHNIKIIKEYSNEQVILYSESNYLIEMISNLIQNSVEAITSKNDEIEGYTITLRTASESDWVLIEVEDNGCGIREKEKKLMFEPLFSGKQGKSNFGIGLHYVKKVVAAHNGHIFVDSVQGKYTKFQIYLQKTVQ